MSTVPTRGTVRIDVESCKGCDLCIEACPHDVLRMSAERVNARGYRYPELLAGCTGCRRCVQICPDFVFQVYKYDEPVELPEGPVEDSAIHRYVDPLRSERH
jgi:2-oxoglutarate ferredoxin oxidoreductase subunit delta